MHPLTSFSSPIKKMKLPLLELHRNGYLSLFQQILVSRPSVPRQKLDKDSEKKKKPT